jgi:uncharacterized protein (DUF1015 family)
VTVGNSSATNRLTLRPFRALRYSPNRVPDLAAVTSPPYDVIGEEGVRHYEQADPVNVVRLILPRPFGRTGEPAGTGDRYAHAARDLQSWLDAGILVEEQEPSVWVYEQRIGDSRWRGLLAAVSVHDPGSPAVVPHEEVFPAPVLDRAALMEATATQPEPIMLVLDAVESLGQRLWARPLQQPEVAVTTEDGVGHWLWQISDAAEIAALNHVVGTGYAFIADGHHRYAAYQHQRHRHAGDPDSGWAFGLAWLVDVATDPLLLSAIHRTLTGMSLPEFAARISPYVRCSELPADLDAWLGRLHAATETSFVVTDGIRAIRLHNAAPGLLATWLSRQPASLRQLDPVILHEALLPAALGITEGDPRVGYEHNAVAACMWARRSGGLAILLRPPDVRDVLAAAAAGLRLPRKSTSFGPKPRNGLILRRVTRAV